MSRRAQNSHTVEQYLDRIQEDQDRLLVDVGIAAPSSTPEDMI